MSNIKAAGHIWPTELAMAMSSTHAIPRGAINSGTEGASVGPRLQIQEIGYFFTANMQAFY